MAKTALRAATYSRKSTQQRDIEDASTDRQIALAKSFAETKGWTIVADYLDEGVSGRARTKLIGRAKLFLAAEEGQFDVVIVRDSDRLSRDDEETDPVALLRDSDVQVWEYTTGQMIDVSDTTGRLVRSVHRYRGASYAESVSKNTREQKLAKARAGGVADGKVFGYRTVGEAKARKREIDPKQAATVKRIFGMSADGIGLLRIVRTLNDEGVVNATGQHRIGSSKAGKYWATTGVRELLRRDLYRGVIVYGKTRNVWKHGKRTKIAIPEKDWIKVSAPHLRVVSDNLWKRVQDRLAKTLETYPGRKTDGRLAGRREAGLVSQYLLSGFLRCGICGSNMFVTARSGRWGVKRYYICTTAHTRGSAACSNTKGVPYEPLTESVIATLKDKLFNKAILGQILADRLKELTAGTEGVQEEIETMRAEITKIDASLEHLLDAIEEGGDAKSIMPRMRSLEQDRDALTAKLEHLDGMLQAAGTFDPVKWMADISGLLSTLDVSFGIAVAPESARKILRECLRGPIKVTPDEEGGWDFEADGFFDQGRLAEVVKTIKGRIAPDRLTPASTKFVPPG
jgi:site-specific DNA recombinase